MLNVTLANLIWKDLHISPKELRLDTLRCGQSFRWKNIEDKWISVLQGNLIVLKETPSSVFYGTVDGSDKIEPLLRDYFQLDKVSLESCYSRWSQLDANFKLKSVHFQGIRILRQDPWENLICFICSSNNNISRITQMVNKLCVHYGQKVGQLEGEVYYDFPTLDSLVQDGVEAKLRELGFGYRAKYIANTAKKIKEEHGQLDWLYSLRKVSYQEAKEELMKLPGVGPKVADCVCLMSLDHPESIPVDTHVWQIAQRSYGFNKKGKSLTSKLYVEVGNHFRLLFGEYSGWAHSVLFTADLKSFEQILKKRKLE
ncbi:unnamed protein product [Rhizopus microsporus]